MEICNFFSHQVSKWKTIEKYNLEKDYIGQIDSVISTIGSMFNTQDTDMLPTSSYKSS